MIDTKVAKDNKYPKIVIIYLGFDDNLFKDTLFLGEMIKEVIDDICGEPTDKSLLKRLNKLQEQD